MAGLKPERSQHHPDSQLPPIAYDSQETELGLFLFKLKSITSGAAITASCSRKKINSNDLKPDSS
jgi:hypothetical protein